MKYPKLRFSKQIKYRYYLSDLSFTIWAISILILNLVHFSQSSAQPTRTMNAAELELALKKLNVLGSVLYLAAHPDDENTALLSYLSSERLLRTAYLSTTRGDGGQNLIGSEKGALMGVIRTQELLAARRIDGAEQFFTRAIDFGYSKTPEEAIRIWGEDAIVSDMVWIIRNFRPDVIITRFAPEFGGHGHHRASAILAEKAFHAAGNPSMYPDQLEYVDVWQPKRMVWNAWSRAMDPADAKDMVRVDVGKYNSLLGKSYTEISAESRSMHKSQGFGARGRRGQSPEYFQHTSGQRAIGDLFEGIDLSWNRVDGGNAVSSGLDEAIAAFQGDNPASILPHLLRIREAIDALPPGYWKSQKQRELQKIILSAAGLWAEAIVDEFSAVPGGQIEATISVVNRSDFPITLHSIVLPFAQEANVVGLALPDNQPFETQVSVALPEELELSQPYWLESKGSLGLFRVEDQKLIGQPEAPPLSARIVFSAGNQLFEVKTPLLYRWVDRVGGELYRPLEIIPGVAINLDKGLYVFANEQSREIGVKLKAGRSDISGTLRLQVPENWHVEPARVKFTLTEKDEESLLFFSVVPPEFASKGTIRAEAMLNSGIESRGRATIDYPHIPIRTLFPPAEADLLRLDITIHDEEIAYIMGSGDDIPGSLEQLGYRVTNLSDEDLENGDLKRFDTIIAGIRAYNTRQSLRHYHGRLLDFVFSGGTFIVQYNTSRDVLVDNLGPYPMELSRDRVSVENAPVKMVLPEHPLLNVPNKIGPGDFEGWVQERGLYFAGQWDSRYDAPLSSHDPGETEKRGSLLFCRYGEGVFIYTGLSWFRELPAGVPGAFRLFVNMISAGKSSGSETN